MVSRVMSQNGHAAQAEILAAASKCFARCGYAGTSVQAIVNRTRFTKPTLYYHFSSKQGLFQAVLDDAYDESYRRMRKAAAVHARHPRARLADVLTSQFEFLRDRKELLRLVLATAFAPPGELPAKLRHTHRRRRNFEFVASLVRQAQREGLLKSRFTAHELARAIYGAMTFRLMTTLLLPRVRLDRRAARRIVDVFWEGACSQGPS